jgi:rod shape-determining protein MreC
VEGSRQKAILAGTNEDMPVLKYLPVDTDIAEGTRIITSGNGGLFMPGLPIGTVVRAKDGNLYVRLYADISRLTHVRIVDYPEDPNLIEAPLRD